MWKFERYRAATGITNPTVSVHDSILSIVDSDTAGYHKITDLINSLHFSIVVSGNFIPQSRCRLKLIEPPRALAPSCDDIERMRELLKDLGNDTDPGDTDYQQEFEKKFTDHYLPLLRQWTEMRAQHARTTRQLMADVVVELSLAGYAVSMTEPEPHPYPEDMTVADLLAIDNADDRIGYIVENRIGRN